MSSPGLGNTPQTGQPLSQRLPSAGLFDPKVKLDPPFKWDGQNGVYLLPTGKEKDLLIYHDADQSGNRTPFQGGEALVYFADPRREYVFKLFRKANDPVFGSDPDIQQRAQDKIDESKRRIRTYPASLASTVIAPLEIVVNEQNPEEMLGFIMRTAHGEKFEDFLNINWQDLHGYDLRRICRVFLSLWDTINALHQDKMVVGDLKGPNLKLMNDDTVRMIDVESQGFSGFNATAITLPLFWGKLLKINAGGDLVQNGSPCSESDWHTFRYLLFQALTGTEPYLGRYTKKNPDTGNRYTAEERVVKGLTCFEPEAKPQGIGRDITDHSVLPIDIRDELREALSLRRQGPFPRELLEKYAQLTTVEAQERRKTHLGFSWDTHRHIPAVRPVPIKYDVTSTPLQGPVHSAVSTQAGIYYVCDVAGRLTREDGTLVSAGRNPPRICCARDASLAPMSQAVILSRPKQSPVKASEGVHTSLFGTLSFGVGGKYIYVICNPDQPMTNHKDPQRRIPHKAGLFRLNMESGSRTPIFDTIYEGAQVFTSDRLTLVVAQADGEAGPGPGWILQRDQKDQSYRIQSARRIPGEPVKGEVYFSRNFAWFCVQSKDDSGALKSYAILYNAFGRVVGMTRCENDTSWLSNLDGKHAFETADGKPALLTSSPYGIMIVKPTQSGDLAPEVGLLPVKKSNAAEPIVDPKEIRAVFPIQKGNATDFDILTSTTLLQLRG